MVRYGFLAVALLSILAGFVLIPSVLDPYAAFCRICAGFFNPMLKFFIRELGEAGVYNHYTALAITTSVAASIIPICSHSHRGHDHRTLHLQHGMSRRDYTRYG